MRAFKSKVQSFGSGKDFGKLSSVRIQILKKPKGFGFGSENPEKTQSNTDPCLRTLVRDSTKLFSDFFPEKYG